MKGALTSKKVYYGMLGAIGLALVILAAGIFLGDRWLHKRSDELKAVKLESRLLDEQQGALVQANKDIVKYADLETIANTIVPKDKDQAKTIREIVNLAEAAEVPISSISFPSSTLGNTTPKTTTTDGSAPATDATKTPPVTQVKAVDGINGVYQMEITVQSDNAQPVPYESLLNFLERLEQNRRTAQVSNITVTPSTKDSRLVTFSLVINVYIKP